MGRKDQWEFQMKAFSPNHFTDFKFNVERKTNKILKNRCALNHQDTMCMEAKLGKLQRCLFYKQANESL